MHCTASNDHSTHACRAQDWLLQTRRFSHSPSVLAARGPRVPVMSLQNLQSKMLGPDQNLGIVWNTCVLGTNLSYYNIIVSWLLFVSGLSDILQGFEPYLTLWTRTFPFHLGRKPPAAWRAQDERNRHPNAAPIFVSERDGSLGSSAAAGRLGSKWRCPKPKGSHFSIPKVTKLFFVFGILRFRRVNWSIHFVGYLLYVKICPQFLGNLGQDAAKKTIQHFSNPMRRPQGMTNQQTDNLTEAAFLWAIHLI